MECMLRWQLIFAQNNKINLTRGNSNTNFISISLKHCKMNKSIHNADIRRKLMTKTSLQHFNKINKNEVD